MQGLRSFISAERDVNGKTRLIYDNSFGNVINHFAPFNGSVSGKVKIIIFLRFEIFYDRTKNQLLNFSFLWIKIKYSR